MCVGRCERALGNFWQKRTRLCGEPSELPHGLCVSRERGKPQTVVRGKNFQRASKRPKHNYSLLFSSGSVREVKRHLGKFEQP